MIKRSVLQQFSIEKSTYINRTFDGKVLFRTICNRFRITMDQKPAAQSYVIEMEQKLYQN